MIAATIPSSHASDAGSDIEAYLSKIQDKKFDWLESKISCCLLTSGMTLSVPFGSVCGAWALGPHRPKIVSTLTAAAPKKKQTPRKEGVEDEAPSQNDGKETYALWAFFPLLRKKDAEQRPDIALSVYARLLSATHHMPKKWSENPSVQKWKACLQQVSEDAKRAEQPASNCDMHDAEP